MLKKQLENLFKNFQEGFKNYNLEQVSTCYHVPCTLNMPDRLVFVKNEQDLADEISSIFTQLNQGKVTNIIAVNASYQTLSEKLILTAIDWHFIDENEQLFADFCGIYHIQIIGDELKIINVASHELANSLCLENKLSVKI